MGKASHEQEGQDIQIVMNNSNISDISHIPGCQDSRQHHTYFPTSNSQGYSSNTAQPFQKTMTSKTFDTQSLNLSKS